MAKSNKWLGPHEAVKASDGWWYCKCGWRKGRSYTLQAVNTHIAMQGGIVGVRAGDGDAG